MIESKLQTRANRNRPLPRLNCEHVVAGCLTAAQIVRDGVMLSVCRECWTKQDLLRVTVDGKVVKVE